MMKMSRRRLYLVLSSGIVLLLTMTLQFGGLNQGRLSLSVAHADSTNLVQNPGFESGRDGWFDFGGSGATTTSSGPHTGSSALVTGPGQQGVGQLISLAPNTVYSFSAWGRTTGSGEYEQITLRVTDTSNNSVDYQMPFSISDWTRQARTITTPSNVQQGLVYILKNSGTGYFYADDIAIAQGRDVEAWPFSRNSIWNTPIGSNAVYQSVPLSLEKQYNADETTLIQADTNAPRRDAYLAGNIDSANDFGSCNRDPSQGSVGGPEGTLQIPNGFVLDNATRNPNFRPNNPGWIVQGDGRTAAQFGYLVRCDGQGPAFGYRGVDTDLYGDGAGGAHFGSGLSAGGGALREGELIGPGAIRHALQLEFWAEKLASNNPTFRWPANNSDYGSSTSYCSLDPCKSNPGAFASFKPGALAAIPPSVTPESLGIKTEPGKKIFQALQDFGGYFVDSTGWYYQSIGAEYGVRSEFNGAYGYDFNVTDSATGGALDWYNDLTAIFSHLAVVDNNSPTSIGGGGTPRTDLAPDFATSPSTPDPVSLDRSGWTATASVNSADASKILDGDTSTYWDTGVAQSSGQNIVVDLQSPTAFNAVLLDASTRFADFPQNFEVYVSNDGVNWGTSIFSATGNGTTGTYATFPTQVARYVKIQLSAGSISNATWSVDEFNLYTTTVN